jgi:hypothetical protein
MLAARLMNVDVIQKEKKIATRVVIQLEDLIIQNKILINYLRIEFKERLESPRDIQFFNSI